MLPVLLKITLRSFPRESVERWLAGPQKGGVQKRERSNKNIGFYGKDRIIFIVACEINSQVELMNVFVWVLA